MKVCLPVLAESGSFDPSLTRQLQRVLHLLTVTALVLGLFLALAVAGALWAYRRNRSREPRA